MWNMCKRKHREVGVNFLMSHSWGVKKSIHALLHQIKNLTSSYTIIFWTVPGLCNKNRICIQECLLTSTTTWTGETDIGVPYFCDTLKEIIQECWPGSVLQMGVCIYLTNKTGSIFNMLVWRISLWNSEIITQHA